MANTLSPYNPTFYAAEALILLQNALGMANRVYRGYETERKGYNLGETVQVRKPSEFQGALEQALKAGKPALIDVKTHIEGIAPHAWLP